MEKPSLLPAQFRGMAFPVHQTIAAHCPTSDVAEKEAEDHSAIHPVIFPEDGRDLVRRLGLKIAIQHMFCRSHPIGMSGKYPMGGLARCTSSGG